MAQYTLVSSTPEAVVLSNRDSLYTIPLRVALQPRTDKVTNNSRKALTVLGLAPEDPAQEGVVRFFCMTAGSDSRKVMLAHSIVIAYDVPRDAKRRGAGGPPSRQDARRIEQLEARILRLEQELGISG